MFVHGLSLRQPEAPMSVPHAEYTGVVLMKFEEQLREWGYPEVTRRRMHRVLQIAIKQADEWKQIADSIRRAGER